MTTTPNQGGSRARSDREKQDERQRAAVRGEWPREVGGHEHQRTLRRVVRVARTNRRRLA